MQSPHRAIDAYVEAFTNFKPTDASDWVAKEPQLTFDLGTEISKLTFCKMSKSFPLHVKSNHPECIFLIR
jgi:hypothetical protein